MPPKDKGWYLSTKGYPRYSAGPDRGRYVHRVVAARKIGRELTKDEDVHHVDGDRTNFAEDNLLILGHAEHGWVSAAQHWFMKRKEVAEKAEWESLWNCSGPLRLEPKERIYGD